MYYYYIVLPPLMQSQPVSAPLSAAAPVSIRLDVSRMCGWSSRMVVLVRLFHACVRCMRGSCRWLERRLARFLLHAGGGMVAVAVVVHLCARVRGCLRVCACVCVCYVAFYQRAPAWSRYCVFASYQ